MDDAMAATKFRMSFKAAGAGFSNRLGAVRHSIAESIERQKEIGDEAKAERQPFGYGNRHIDVFSSRAGQIVGNLPAHHRRSWYSATGIASNSQNPRRQVEELRKGNRMKVDASCPVVFPRRPRQIGEEPSEAITHVVHRPEDVPSPAQLDEDRCNQATRPVDPKIGEVTSGIESVVIAGQDLGTMPGLNRVACHAGDASSSVGT